MSLVAPVNSARPLPDAGWLARRRWSRAGLVYLTLILCSFVFMGPLLFATLSSLKTDPLEYPPRLLFEQLNPANWAAAWTLGRAGSGDGWLGGFAPGADVSFTTRYLVRQGQQPVPPEVVVPRRRPGLAQAVAPIYAADYAKLEAPRQVSATPAAMPDGSPGQLVTYRFRVTYPGQGPKAPKLPLDVTAPIGQVFAGATLAPTLIERAGRVQTYDNAAPGFVGYLLRNYVRVFDNARSITTGQSLFLQWMLNSFGYVLLKVLSTVLIASMAGYALARLAFPGRGSFFVLILFLMTLPNQVLFISNYLVLRDGIWGLSRLWGQPGGMLNSLPGLWAVTFVSLAAVFLMKQFFETLPRELEEAAKIDGASAFQTFWRVIMPNAGPALVALTITTAQGAWNEYFWALVALQTPDDRYTLPIGLNALQRGYGAASDYSLILPGAIISAIPVIILFIVFQRYFIQGVATTGGKE